MRVAEKGYRPDIDGMRGFGALIVMIFHLNREFLPGGVSSLTWFFVYSGYLITRNIVHAVNEDRFSFSYFYLRRARRLFPAHIFVLALTMIVSAFILSPRDLMEMGQSVVAVSLFSGNIFFSTVTGYFDSDAYQKPLLHTWSLSIEEQYYFLWPFVVVLLLRFRSHRAAVFFLSTAMILSLFLAVGMYEKSPQAAYYLLPSRMFEFMAGSLMVWIVPYRLKSKAVLELLGLAALLGIILPLFLYELETPYPGTAVIVPVLAVCFLIYAGPQKLTGYVFNNRVFVALGQISYSLYLIHWPIITLYKYYFLSQTLSLLEQACLVAASILSATLIYFFIETPFRFSRDSRAGDKMLNNNRFVVGAILLTGFVSIAGAVFYKTNGLERRFPVEVRQSIERASSNVQVAVGEEKGCYIDTLGEFKGFMKEGRHRCLSVNPGKSNYLILGDSAAGMIYYGLKEVFPEVNFLGVSASACPAFLNVEGTTRRTLFCQDLQDYIYGDFLLQTTSIDKVILAMHAPFEKDYTHRWASVLDYLIDHGHTPVVVMIGPRYKESVPELIYHYGKNHNLEEWLKRYELSDQVKQKNQQLEKIVDERGLEYIPSFELMCPDGRCTVFSNGVPVIVDHVHYTKEGSLYFARQVKENVPEFVE